MPSSSATAFATAWLSPVSMATSHAHLVQPLDRFPALRADDVRQGEAGHGLSSTTRWTTLWPLSLASFKACQGLGQARFRLSSRRGPPT